MSGRAAGGNLKAANQRVAVDTGYSLVSAGKHKRTLKVEGLETFCVRSRSSRFGRRCSASSRLHSKQSSDLNQLAIWKNGAERGPTETERRLAWPGYFPARPAATEPREAHGVRGACSRFGARWVVRKLQQARRTPYASRGSPAERHSRSELLLKASWLSAMPLAPGFRLQPLGLAVRMALRHGCPYTPALRGCLWAGWLSAESVSAGQSCIGASSSRGLRSCRGSQMRKTVPRPTWLSSSIRPPWARTMRCTIISPRP